MKRKNIFLLLFLLIFLLNACSDRSGQEPQPTPSSGRPTMPQGENAQVTSEPEPSVTPIPVFECGEPQVTQQTVKNSEWKYVSGERKLTDVDRALENGEIVPVKSGDSLFLDEDAERDTFTLEYGEGSEAEGYPFRLTCGSVTLEGTTHCASGEMYAAKLSGTRGDTVQLLVPKSSYEHPGGAEVVTYMAIVYSAAEGSEILAYFADLNGGLKGIRKEIQIAEDGFWREGRWSFPGAEWEMAIREKVSLCRGYVEDYIWDLCVVPPEGDYPVRTLAQTKAPLYVYQYGEEEPSAVLRAGSVVALGSTDGREWVSFEPLSTEISGWLRLEMREGKTYVKGPQDVEITDSGLNFWTYAYSD